jgi:hypothetical protein
MGPNSKRAQQATAASRNTSARARFSKPPPNKKKGGRGGGRSSGGGRGGRGRGGRGNGSGNTVNDGSTNGGRGRGNNNNNNNNNNKNASDATRANVISKISKRVEGKSKSLVASKSKHPLAGLDKSKFDEVTLTDESIQLVTQLLTDLNVMEGHQSKSIVNADGDADANANDGDGNEDDGKKNGNDHVHNDESKYDHEFHQASEDVPTIDETSPLFLHLTMQLSFSSHHAKRACHAIHKWSISLPNGMPAANTNLNPNINTNSNSSSNTSNNQTESVDEIGLAMDWLCLHLTEDELKEGFKPNHHHAKNNNNNTSKTHPLSSRNNRAMAHPSISLVKPDKEWLGLGSSATILQTRMVGFVRLGFHHVEAERACRDKGKGAAAVVNNPVNDEALSLLLSLLEKEVLQLDRILHQDSLSAGDLEFVASEREQEVQALEAIFGKEFKKSLVEIKGDKHMNMKGNGNGKGLQLLEERYLLKIRSNETLQQPARSEESKLHVIVRPGYPVFTPPLFLFTNPTLPPSLLREINIAMIHRAHQCIGEAVVFNMVNFLCTDLGSMQRKFIAEQRAKEFKEGQNHQDIVASVPNVQPRRPSSRKSPTGVPKTAAFMDKLRANFGNAELNDNRHEYHLTKAANKEVAVTVATAAPHVPAPVAVPTGDLGNIIKDVVKIQSEQPWLVSSEARAPALDSEANVLTPEQQNRRDRISQNLFSELKYMHELAEQWSKKSGKDDKGSKDKKGAQQFYKMLSQRQR